MLGIISRGYVGDVRDVFTGGRYTSFKELMKIIVSHIASCQRAVTGQYLGGVL